MAAVFVAASAAAAVEPAFGAWTTVARWEMNEGTNATVMHDKSGHDRDGTIGDVVETGLPVSGDNRHYRWPSGDPAVENPERLVRVRGRAFNPREDRFSVTVRFRTTAADQNIMQKGQAQTAGGMWKIDMNNSRVFCFFKGSAGQAAIGSEQGVSLADGDWHTVRCVRRPGGVTIVVDGGTPRTHAKSTGRIGNDWPLAIGGKLQCNPANNVSCEYYVGDIDRAVVKRQ